MNMMYTVLALCSPSGVKQIIENYIENTNQTYNYTAILLSVLGLHLQILAVLLSKFHKVLQILRNAKH